MYIMYKQEPEKGGDVTSRVQAAIGRDCRLRLTPYGLSPVTLRDMGTTRHTFWGRAYGLDIRVEQEDDGTLSVYGAEAYTEQYELLARGPVEEMVRRYDVSGGLRRWLERQVETPHATQASARPGD